MISEQLWRYELEQVLARSFRVSHLAESVVAVFIV